MIGQMLKIKLIIVLELFQIWKKVYLFLHTQNNMSLVIGQSLTDLKGHRRSL